MRKAFIGGNWKSNNTLKETQTLISNVVDKLEFDKEKTQVIIAPIYLHLVTALFTKKQPDVQVCAQNVSKFSTGAYTGEIAPSQLKDININWAIIGHSERRTHMNEKNQDLAKKVENALKNKLKVIYCFGQTLQQRENNQQKSTVISQLDAIKDVVDNWDDVVLAYEPVWAIGTGKVATPDQVAIMHKFIREYLQKNIQNSEGVRIIYGGSVNAKNSDQLIQVDNVDGFLVGGASLKEDFISIVKSAELKKN